MMLVGVSMAGFKTGIVVGALLVGTPAVWLINKLEAQPVRFPSAHVGVQPDYVRVIGSVIGTDKLEKDRPVNNGMVMSCWRPEKTCEYMQLNEISTGHVSDPVNDTLKVRKGDEAELIADSLDLSREFNGCAYYEVRVLLKSKQATYTRLPNPKADKARCDELFKDSQPVKQWRIGDGKAWEEYDAGE